jgi:hypothetical protein
MAREPVSIPPRKHKANPRSRPYTRHGLTAPMVRVKLAGFNAIDRRTTAAREHLALRRELANALGGEAALTPQQRKLIDMAARASALLDHVDAWLFQQPRLVNARAKTLLPILVQRQALADHLMRLLDKLPVPEHAPGDINVQRAVVLLPDNHRDRLSPGGTTNGQHSAHQSPAPQSPTPTATVELPPRDADDFISPNGDRHDDDNDDLERDLGLR